MKKKIEIIFLLLSGGFVNQLIKKFWPKYLDIECKYNTK